ncbi:MAG: glucans biosynthesis glucosyltransferase MdoH [Hyphomicrobiales bacterium]
MAVQVDRVMLRVVPGETEAKAKDAVFMPPESPLAMPVQNLKMWPPGKAIRSWRLSKRVMAARLFVFGAAAALTGWGTYEIYHVVAVTDASWLQTLFATLFALTFAWIAFSCASAIIGFWRIVTGRRAHIPESGIVARNALLMPVYNEDPHHVFSALEIMGRSLADAGAGTAFDIYVLSDTRDLAIADAELKALSSLREALDGRIAVYYRRRLDNYHRKAGNIADWVTRWGGAYDHMIVLDADSIMTADTMTALARAMEADPHAGIIQSVPVLFNRVTLFARVQQFCGRVYGPVVAEGLAAWHGRDGNYWGHNAIIRVRAFADAAGLPELPGRKPFGGHILSHDFIEAALMRRAGWSVMMLPELGGSYEECPPTLLDLAVRDRRWAQGNLQHSKIVGARGLHWVSRVHLLQGIMSYLASPLWFALLVTGLILSLQAQYTQPNYFPDGFSLFPSWPVFDPERALRLFWITMVVLFLPKVLAIVAAFFDRELRRGCGGVFGLLSSLFAESVLSALLAPVTMLTQSHVVIDILRGRDSGWNKQNRADEGITFGFAVRRCAKHLIVGALMAAAALAVSFDTFLWTLPITLGLLLSATLTWWTSRPEAGLAARRLGLFLIPEETIIQVKAADPPAGV